MLHTVNEIAPYLSNRIDNEHVFGKLEWTTSMLFGKVVISNQHIVPYKGHLQISFQVR
jgi:hypothetical protein